MRSWIFCAKEVLPEPVPPAIPTSTDMGVAYNPLRDGGLRGARLLFRRSRHEPVAQPADERPLRGNDRGEPVRARVLPRGGGQPQRGRPALDPEGAGHLLPRGRHRGPGAADPGEPPPAGPGVGVLRAREPAAGPGPVPQPLSLPAPAALRPRREPFPRLAGSGGEGRAWVAGRGGGGRPGPWGGPPGGGRGGRPRGGWGAGPPGG